MKAPLCLVVVGLLLIARSTADGTGIRLVSPTGKSESVTSGRLEVLVNDVWGTVCSKHFGKNEAIVACRQLGFKTKSPHYSPISSADYPEVSPLTPILLPKDTSCSTTEFTSCLRDESGANSSCTHEGDVLLSCSSRKGLSSREKLILATVLGALTLLFSFGLCILAACTLPTALRRRAQEKERVGAVREADSKPLLANIDKTNISEPPLKLPRPPPTNPAVILTLGPTTPIPSAPVFQGGVPYMPPLKAMPPQKGPPLPPPLVMFHTPQESMTYSAPDVPSGGVLPFAATAAPIPPGAMYPPRPPTTAPPYYMTSPYQPLNAPTPANDGEPVAKESTLLTDPRLRYDMQASATSLSTIASALAGVNSVETEDDTGETKDGSKPGMESSTSAAVSPIYPSLDASGGPSGFQESSHQ